jgi:hypothetical protein
MPIAIMITVVCMPRFQDKVIYTSFIGPRKVLKNPVCHILLIKDQGQILEWDCFLNQQRKHYLKNQVQGRSKNLLRTTIVSW